MVGNGERGRESGTSIYGWTKPCSVQQQPTFESKVSAGKEGKGERARGSTQCIPGSRARARSLHSVSTSYEYLNAVRGSRQIENAQETGFGAKSR